MPSKLFCSETRAPRTRSPHDWEETMWRDGSMGQWLGCLAGGCSVGPTLLSWLALIVASAAIVLTVRRAMTFVYTLRAVALTPKLSRLLSRVVKTRSYSDEGFFRADCANPASVERRKAGIERLARRLSGGRPRSAAWGEALRDRLSGLRFTDARRVPLPF